MKRKTIPEDTKRAPHNPENNESEKSETDAQSQMRILQKENATLLAENEDLSTLVNDYESVLEKVLEGLRIFISYASQLAVERQVNADLRQEAAEFQARLTKFSAILRTVHENENALGPDTLIEELKIENAALREALGVKSG
ncbi:hypothetical protein AA313_de0209347 [Arthrobotrys entomopaga]|nr:hypothetical protein AA313_de0209347 [Arthrobotrys entomopaga]